MEKPGLEAHPNLNSSDCYICVSEDGKSLLRDPPNAHSGPGTRVDSVERYMRKLDAGKIKRCTCKNETRSAEYLHSVGKVQPAHDRVKLPGAGLEPQQPAIGRSVDDLSSTARTGRVETGYTMNTMLSPEQGWYCDLACGIAT